jgi:transcriptional regulator with XRE-family HTH domain
MAREPTDGQKAAGRLVKARRAELKLDQQDLAELAVDVSERTIRSFERGQRWPHAQKLAAIERSLGWRSGYLADYAAAEDKRLSAVRPHSDPDIAAVLASDMNDDDKLRLVDRLRTVRVAEIHRETAEVERLLAELSLPGEGDKGQEIA